MVIFIIRYPDIKPDTMIHPGARRGASLRGTASKYRQMYHIKMNNAMQEGDFVFRVLWTLHIKLLLLMLYLLCFIWTSSFPSSILCLKVLQRRSGNIVISHKKWFCQSLKLEKKDSMNLNFYFSPEMVWILLTSILESYLYWVSLIN